MDLLNNYFSDHLLFSLGWTFIHTLWQGVAVSFLLWIYFLSNKKFPANIKYTVSAGAMITILALAVITFWKIYSEYDDYRFISQNFMTASKDYLHNELANVVYGNTNSLSGINGLLVKTSSFLDSHYSAIVFLWFIGIIIIGLKYTGALLYLVRLKKLGTAPLSSRWSDMAARIISQIGLTSTVRILESALARTPMVIGWIKPVILFPAGLLSAIPYDQVEAIISHELAHIKRNDYVVNILQSLMEILFFFNPSVWWISGIIRKEREHCCDDIAVRVCGEPFIYASALLTLNERNIEMPDLSIAFSGKRHLLFNRIKRITIMSDSKSTLRGKCMTISFITLLISGLTISTGFKLGNNRTEYSPMELQIAGPIIKAQQTSDLPGTRMIVKTEPAIERILVVPGDTVKRKISGTIRTEYTDSVMKKKSDVRMEFREGKLIELIIDANVIPEIDYPKYHDLIDDTVSDIIKAEATLKEDEAKLKEAEREMEKINEAALEAESEAHKTILEAQEVEIEVQKAEFEAQRVGSNARKLEYEAQKAEFEAQKAESEAQKIEFEAQSVNAKTRRVNLETSEVEARVQKADAEIQKAERIIQQAEPKVQKVKAEIKKRE